MELGLNAPKKVPIYAHPNGTVLVSLIGLIGGALTVYTLQSVVSQVESLLLEGRAGTGEALKILWPFRAPLASFALGVAVGLPSVLIEKRLLRSHISFYADFFLMPLAVRLRWSVFSTNLLVCLPIMLGPLLAMGIACALRIAPWPSCFGTSIWFFLTYPEYKSIYEMAQSRTTPQRSQI